jgi:hypothetical protein
MGALPQYGVEIKPEIRIVLLVWVGLVAQVTKRQATVDNNWMNTRPDRD